jgi:hypothetical protein
MNREIDYSIVFVKFNKIKSIINSCESIEHIVSSWRIIENFIGQSCSFTISTKTINLLTNQLKEYLNEKMLDISKKSYNRYTLKRD